MEKILKHIAIALFLLMPQLGMAQSKWDAATCVDICNLLLNNRKEVKDTLVGKFHYEFVTDITTEGTHVYLYVLNMTCNKNGDIIKLEKQGVSNYLMAGWDMHNFPTIATAFFSTTNAAKFRQQAFNAGFKKSRVEKGETYYKSTKIPGVGMMETTKRLGGHTLYSFSFYLNLF